MTDHVMCGNEEHPEPIPAIVRTTWPGGRFNTGTACRDCLEMLLEDYVLPGPGLIEGPYSVIITPAEVLS